MNTRLTIRSLYESRTVGTRNCGPSLILLHLLHASRCRQWKHHLHGQTKMTSQRIEEWATSSNYLINVYCSSMESERDQLGMDIIYLGQSIRFVHPSSLHLSFVHLFILSLTLLQSFAQDPVTRPAYYNHSAPAGSRFDYDLPSSTVGRLYHSSATLLVDGSVFIAGSNPNSDVITEANNATCLSCSLFFQAEDETNFDRAQTLTKLNIDPKYSIPRISIVPDLSLLEFQSHSLTVAHLSSSSCLLVV
jgi:hypothetical protein